MKEKGKVLVIGASGALGRAVAVGLAEEGFSVRVGGRSRGRLVELFGERFEVAELDATDAPSVARALDGCRGVHVSVAHGGDERPAVEVVSRAARDRGLSRISYVSGTSVCEANAWFPMVRTKLESEELLRVSGVPYTIFRPTWFFETLANFVKRGKCFLFGAHKKPYHLVAASDFAKMVARSYALDEAKNETFQIHGPEGLSLLSALERYIAALHPEIPGVTKLPIWLTKTIAFVRRNEPMKFAAAFSDYFARVGEGRFTPRTTELLGSPSTTLDAWLAERRPSAS